MLFLNKNYLVVTLTILSVFLLQDGAIGQVKGSKEQEKISEVENELPEGYLKAKEFVENNLIGKVIEVKVESEIDHDVFGKSETEFRRRETFINFFERNDKESTGFRFDSLVVVEQTVWPLDSDGKRSGKKEVRNRVLVSRRVLHPSREQNAALGQSNNLTHSSGEWMSKGPSMKLTMDENVLVLVADIGPYDSPVVDGKSYSRAFVMTDRYEIVDGKLKIDLKEEDFRVDLKTKARTRGTHDVKMSGKEVDGLMAPRD